MAIAPSVLTINAGSSSIKFALYDIEPTLTVSMRGELGRIGINEPTISWTTKNNGSGERPLDAAAAENAAEFLINWLAAKGAFSSITATGHRIVHGLARTEPVRISSDVMAELHRAEPYAPDHLPREIALIEALRSRYPDLPQVACFDTAFHGRMPPVAKLLPIPRRYYDRGVRRYGFHGLSYAYLIEELGRVAGEDAVRGHVILAHLGNGASLTR